MQRNAAQTALTMFFLLTMSMTSHPRLASSQDVVANFSFGQPSGQYAFASCHPNPWRIELKETPRVKQ